MIGIDSNYFLLPISVDVYFGSPVGELLGSHHPEEEVPSTKFLQLFAYSLIDRAAVENDWTFHYNMW
jgi:hypothetical protein